MIRETRALEQILGRVLTVGSIISTTLLAAGLILTLAAARPNAADALLNAGLLALMATPIVRVIVSMVEYAARRDWTFLLLTTTVLLVLLGSWLAA